MRDCADAARPRKANHHFNQPPSRRGIEGVTRRQGYASATGAAPLRSRACSPLASTGVGLSTYCAPGVVPAAAEAYARGSWEGCRAAHQATLCGPEKLQTSGSGALEGKETFAFSRALQYTSAIIAESSRAVPFQGSCIAGVCSSPRNRAGWLPGFAHIPAAICAPWWSSLVAVVSSPGRP